MSQTETPPTKQETAAHDRPLVIPPTAAPPPPGNAVREQRFELLSHGERLLVAETYKALRTGLDQQEELEEQVICPSASFPCYPLDGIVALNKALKQIFGFTHAMERIEETLFGTKKKPALILTVPVGLNETAEVVFGRIAPPAWEGGYIDIVFDPAQPLGILVGGSIKRKFEPAVKAIIEVAKRLLKADSIYRGAACELDLSFVGTPHYHPVHHAPKYIDTTREMLLILPRDIEFELENVWGMIRNPQSFRAMDIPIGHKVLLSGRFGTGKSLTSYKTAQVAARSGWTYFYLKTPHNFVMAYKLAQMYAPSVLFVEDIDAIFGGDRSQFMNEILETLDGVSVKNAEVVVILTTNTPEKINEAFLRSGRVDTHIQLRELDADAAGRFVEATGGDMVEDYADYKAIGEAFNGLVPADVTEGIYKAKRNAIGKGGELKGSVTTEALCAAGEVVRRQRGLIVGDGKSPSEVALEKLQEAAMIVVGPVIQEVLG